MVIRQLIDIIILIIIIVVLLIASVIGISNALSRYEFRECVDWQSDNSGSGFANWQKLQCKNYNIKLN